MSLDARAATLATEAGGQPGWAATSLAARADVLARAATRLAADAEALAAELRAADGRREDEVWSAEIVPTLETLRWLAHDGARALRPRRLRRARLQWYFRATRHELHWEPRGVVGVITPSNSLLFLAVPQVAAALLAGNIVRWKPAPAGGAVARRVAASLAAAGLPGRTLEVVEGDAEAARAIVRAGVDLLHFTGRAEAGHELARLHAARGRPAVLELSGRHVALVLGDADPGLAARGLAWGKLANAGRNCLSVQLVLAERSIAPALLDALVAALGALAPDGPTTARRTDESDRLAALVDDARRRGARLVVGAPEGVVLLTGVRPGMRVVDEEVHGPVLGFAALASADQAVAWVNGGRLRLSASIWSGRPPRAHAIARRLDVGQVWINEMLHPAAHPEVTLAGRGASGYGASRGLAGLMEMVAPKVISTTPLRAPRRHFAPGHPATVDLFRATVAVAFTRGRRRLTALGAVARALARLAGGAR
ncbi:MAG TPA: aldehyde dehydrogenase family protein [Thermoleophilaceae bacterium]|jgi:acyl-CoA reductase-like NAD-dependent aldehyde dehydrogenase